MPPKKQTPPPIDRPLSRAYLREFSGWSTAYPPGKSEPNSLRLMENIWIDRNGAAGVRPGLRYLSYKRSPDLDLQTAHDPGEALGLSVVGGMETFYTEDGSRALLFAVREAAGTVGFRALLFSEAVNPVLPLTDARIGFTIPQGTQVLNFSKGTTHVEYVQINNRILALSDNGEEARMFFVGSKKLAKKLSGIPVPLWEDAHKASAFHPDAAWINARTGTRYRNLVKNSSFEIGTKFWKASAFGSISTSLSVKKYGTRSLRIESLPLRTNLQRLPLHDVQSTGVDGWASAPGLLPCTVAAVGDQMVVSAQGEGLFLADSPKILEGVVPRALYRCAVDVTSVTPARIAVCFYSANGSPIDSRTVLYAGSMQGRFVSQPLLAPDGAASMRVSLGGEASGGAAAGFRNLLVCRDGEPTDFFHGGSGTDYYWTGISGRSPSVHHPPQDVEVLCDLVPLVPTDKMLVRLQGSGTGIVSRGSLEIRYFDKNLQQVSVASAAFDTAVSGWSPAAFYVETIPSTYTSMQMGVGITAVARGESFYIDGGLAVVQCPPDLAYFDGTTANTATTENSWEDPARPHECSSVQLVRSAALPALAAETPTIDTLVATGGAAANEYKMAFFYTFSNEVGESAPSKMTEIRMQRPWSNWLWQKPDADGKPAGDTAEDEACCDQIVVRIPRTVYDQAVAAGASTWSLYAMAWSDQDPVPVTAVVADTRLIYPDSITGVSGTPLPYSEGGWLSATPLRLFTIDEIPLPTQTNRINSSLPPKHSNGLVAGDRIILVGDPDDAATIIWSSSRAGAYTDFSPYRGGGAKTLASGNLDLPVSAVLWQNPQSVDTITVLCAGDDGRSKSYYMQPATIQSSSSGIVAVMGFEETTSTPGTVSPFGAQVVNNAMYRPLDKGLVKSTASNYNINHKALSDQIANMWWGMRSKRRIMTAVLDNRIFFLVDNAEGELLRPGCRGNEIWVLDIAAEKPHWSRALVQATALRPVDVGPRTYMGVATDDGLYYFDPEVRSDDYEDSAGQVRERAIPWLLESNTQGANRAHDAWAHLQQVGVTLGNFSGPVVYGVRGHSLNGTMVDVQKRFAESGPPDPGTAPRWDVDDVLQVRRDLKEWFFYARSVDGEPSSGQISLVQYRYTPVSVNVGYEFGSVETFEYGRDSQGLGGTNTVDGIPVPMMDRNRP